MSVQHGHYTHDDAAGYLDPRCPNCATEREIRRLTTERDAARAREKMLEERVAKLEGALRLHMDEVADFNGGLRPSLQPGGHAYEAARAALSEEP